jgi:hypothetical protein
LFTEPFALLVALSFKPTIEHLQQASGITAEIYPWYSYIAQALLLAFSPVQQSVVQVPGTLSNPSVSTNSESPISIKIINAA